MRRAHQAISSGDSFATRTPVPSPSFNNTSTSGKYFNNLLGYKLHICQFDLS